MNYLIFTVIGGTFLFGLLYYLPIKMKPLHKLLHLVISLSLANIYLYFRPIIGIWQMIIILTLLLLIATYFIVKYSLAKQLLLEESPSEAVDSTITSEKNEQMDSQQITEEVKAEIEITEDVVIDKNSNFVFEEFESETKEIESKDTVELEDKEDIIEVEIPFAELDIIDEIPIDDEEVRKEVEQEENELVLEDEEAMLLERKCVTENTEDHMEPTDDTVQMSENRQHLFAELDGEDISILENDLLIQTAEVDVDAETVEESEQIIEFESLEELQPVNDENTEEISDEKNEHEEHMVETTTFSNEEVHTKSDACSWDTIELTLVDEKVESHQQTAEIEEDVVEESTLLPGKKRRRMDRQMRDIFIEQLHWTKNHVSNDEFEKLLLNYVVDELDDQDYYIFSSLLRDHYISTVQFGKLQELLSKLHDRFDNNPILKEEISFFEKRFF